MVLAITFIGMLPILQLTSKRTLYNTTLSQCILLKIHQYRVQITYKPGPEIFIADWLLRHNHTEGKDKPIKDMDIQVDAIQTTMDMPECLSMAEIQQASSLDTHLQQLKGIIITGLAR